MECSFLKLLHKCFFFYFLCAFATVAYAHTLPVTWAHDDLYALPAVYPATPYVPNGVTNGVHASFLEGIPFKGKPTRFFAYWGVPACAATQAVPAVVLVHGGGGSAFYRWVKFWNRRGFAAIAPDLCGNVSANAFGREQRPHQPHAWAGPGRDCGGFALMDAPVADQWMYHAVSIVMRAHTFLRNQPGVDARRVGLTGVSWGGIVSCVVAACDDRFACAVPVYGCGFLYTDTASWYQRAVVKDAVNKRRDVWCPLWDPAHYLPCAKIPIHWLDGTNDQNFSLPSLTQSFNCVSTPKTLAVRVRMGHAHGPVSEQAPEVLGWLDHHLNGAPALPTIGDVAQAGNRVSAPYCADRRLPVVKGTLDYTTDNSPWWYSNTWQSVAAECVAGRVQAQLPAHTRYYYLNVETANGLRASTTLQTVPPNKAGGAPTVSLAALRDVRILKSDANTYYRDPAAYYEDGLFHLFMTVVTFEKDGRKYDYVGHTTSRDLVTWTPPRLLTVRDDTKNFSSPGNLVKVGAEYILTLQTYPTPGATRTNMPCANSTARIYTMRTRNFKTWTPPELLRVKGEGVPNAQAGRMIDPFLLADRQKGVWRCYYKQNGVSFSESNDLVHWRFIGRADAGENVSVLPVEKGYVMFHSPKNGIGVKFSTDAVHWEDRPGLITLGQQEWPWARGRLTAGTVLDGRAIAGVGKYLMFFHASAPVDFAPASIGIAWSDDLTHWSWPKE